jgi:hypothetical protein
MIADFKNHDNDVTHPNRTFQSTDWVFTKAKHFLTGRASFVRLTQRLSECFATGTKKCKAM